MTAIILRSELSSELPSRRLRHESEELQAPALLLGACLIATLLLAWGWLPSRVMVEATAPGTVPAVQFLPDLRITSATEATQMRAQVSIAPHSDVRPVERSPETQPVESGVQSGSLGDGPAAHHTGQSGVIAPSEVAGRGVVGEIQPGDFVYTDELPAVVMRVAPEYPSLARDAGVEGTVVLWALVGLDGNVEDVRVHKSIPMLDGAALEAVQQWRFTPALANKHAVRVWVAVPVRFRLHG